MKIQQKMILAFSVVAMFVVVIGGLAIYSHVEIKQDIDQIMHSNFKEIEGATQTIFHLQNIQINTWKILLAMQQDTANNRGQEDMDNVKKEIDKSIVELQENSAALLHSLYSWQEAIEAGITLGEANEAEEERKELQFFYLYEDKMHEIIQLVDTFLKYTIQENNLEAALRLLKHKIGPLTYDVHNFLQEMEEDSADELGGEAGKILELLKFVIITSVVITVIALLTAIGIGYYLSLVIVRPLGNLRNAAINIGRGGIDTRIDISTKDEIGELADAFRQMIPKLVHRGELEKSHTYVDNILSSMTDVLLVVSSEGVIKRINRTDLFGVHESELLGTRVGNLFLSGDEEEEVRFTSDGLAILIQMGSISNAEATLAGKDGRSIPVLISGSVLHDMDEKVSDVILVAKDITDYRKAQELLALANERLEVQKRDLKQQAVELVKANQSKAEFLANMSHEIRTPMNAIIGLTDLAMVDEL